MPKIGGAMAPTVPQGTTGLQPILGSLLFEIKALHTYKISDLVKKYCLQFLKVRGN